MGRSIATFEGEACAIGVGNLRRLGGKCAMSNAVLPDLRVVRCNHDNEQHTFRAFPRYSLHNAGKEGLGPGPRCV